jgi:glycosyltransferase involved in cell wall biosynthesis
LESGPLVVLEAFAGGVPVLGSNLGGIAELVEHGVNGFLIEHDKIEAWAATLEKCCDDPQFLNSLCRGIRPPRTMATVADEMLALYHGAIRRSDVAAVELDQP